MGNIDSWEGAVFGIEERIASINDAVDGLSQLFDVLKDIKSSHKRLLKEINCARDDWEACIEWMMSERDKGGRFVAIDVARRAVLVLQNILATETLVEGSSDVEWPSTIDDKEYGRSEKTERDELLESHIIKLMSLTGTERDGSGAHWTSENIEYGLSRIGGGRTLDEIQKAIFGLKSRGIVRFALRAGDEEAGYKDFYVLADGCAEPPKVKSLRERIIEMLSSAMDEDSVLTAWTENQLFYAIKRTSASVSPKKLSLEIDRLEEEGKIAVLVNGSKRIVALSDVSIEKTIGHLIGVGMLDGLAKKEEVKTDTARIIESTKSGDHTLELEQSGAAPAGMGKDRGLGEKILEYMRGQPTRLWRDYDISGHFRSMSIASKMFDEDGSDSPMRKELDLLVKKGLVEFIPRSNNPGQWEDRWRITEPGRAAEKRTQGEAV